MNKRIYPSNIKSVETEKDKNDNVVYITLTLLDDNKVTIVLELLDIINLANFSLNRK